MKKIAIALLLLGSIVITAITGTLAWFSDVFSETPNVEGSVTPDYFESGDGSKDNPYVIARDYQLYNLAWLQYMGYFGSKQLYFKLDPVDDNGAKISTLNMKDWILPPIGTEEYPFIGNFDGNNKCITNLTVCNYLESGKGSSINIVKRPLSVTDMGEDASIVGFFGVVGEYAGGATIDGYQASVNEIKNLFLDNLTVRTETSTSLIGLLAGYVNGNMSNCGVGASQIQIGAGVGPLALEDVNSDNALSLYSIVGYYQQDRTIWESVGGTGEAGEGWGGSINMSDLARRLSYMFTENIRRKFYSSEYEDATLYPVSLYSGSTLTQSNMRTYRFNYDENITGNNFLLAYMGEGTVIPLNVKTDDVFAGDDTEYTIVNYKLVSNSYYSSKSTEPLYNNTGYIVGGGNVSAAWFRCRIQNIDGSNGGITNTLALTDTGEKDDNGEAILEYKITRQAFYPLTVQVDGTEKYIEDENNKSVIDVKIGADNTTDRISSSNFQKYNDVISNFVSTHGDSTKISGIRAFPGSMGGIVVSEGKITSGVTEAIVTMGDYDNAKCELINGAINFNLKEAGYITAIAGTYYDDATHKLFSLYEVNREKDSNGVYKITSVTEIETIWQNINDTKDVEYNLGAYSSTNITRDGKTYKCVYAKDNMNTLDVYGAAYYFEIPVKKGDYAIGAAKGDTNTAYLMYLDVGANAGGGEDTEVKITSEITGVNFVDADILDARNASAEYKIPADYDLWTYKIALVENATETGAEYKAEYSRTNEATMNVTPSGTNTNVDKSEAELHELPKTNTETQQISTKSKRKRDEDELTA